MCNHQPDSDYHGKTQEMLIIIIYPKGSLDTHRNSLLGDPCAHHQHPSTASTRPRQGSGGTQRAGARCLRCFRIQPVPGIGKFEATIVGGSITPRIMVYKTIYDAGARESATAPSQIPSSVGGKKR
jgi:hypothetical protein